jgi:nicotinate-nucleotide adenylyltransferase
VAFFGGSFDPPHLGHVGVARAAKAALELDEVLFAPVGLQPLKMSDGATNLHASFADRVAMVRLAIGDEAGFGVCLLDAPKAGGQPNYTLDTLAEVRREAAQELELFLLVGADTFRLLPRWHRAGEIPFAATLVVVARPGEDLEDLGRCLPKGLLLFRDEAVAENGAVERYGISAPDGRKASLFVLPDLRYEMSATGLREQLQSEGLTAALESFDPRVLAYIREHGLYR